MHRLTITLLLALALTVVGAAETNGPPEGLLKHVTAFLGGKQPDKVATAPVEGLHEITFGPHVFYLSNDGRYLLRGDVFDLQEKAVNLTEMKRRKARVHALEGIGEDSMIVFAPQEVKHTVTIFTDIDCAYCRKLHGDMAALNDLGIKVRYLAFPRAGIPSGSYDKTVSVWCADDRNKAMTDAKSGRAVEPKTCTNPVRDHFSLGERLGISATPTIVFETGSVRAGYRSASELLAVVKRDKSS